MNIQGILSEYKIELMSALVGSILTAIAIVFVLGRERFMWVVKELLKLYSSEKSYFSKKRIESGVAFIILQHGMIFWLAKKYDVMTTADFVMWATIEVGIAGWTVSQIQAEKKTNANAGQNVSGSNGQTPQ